MQENVVILLFSGNKMGSYFLQTFQSKKKMFSDLLRARLRRHEADRLML
jgi:hypothetical protein